MANPVRQNKIAERIKEEVAQILQNEAKDPRIGMVSVVRVKVSQDLRDARVFVSVLGAPADKTKAMKALQHARGYVQTLIAKRIEVRFSPIISFHLDESIEKSIRLSKLIDGVAAERRAKEAAERGVPVEQIEAEEAAAEKAKRKRGEEDLPAPGEAIPGEEKEDARDGKAPENEIADEGPENEDIEEEDEEEEEEEEEDDEGESEDQEEDDEDADEEEGEDEGDGMR
jgi:ribosome-binding factor A